MLLGTGVIWISQEKVKYDYSKYLGPDWKLSFDNPSTIVENHSCWLDILTSIYLKFPGFAAKEGIRNWPFCAAIAHGNSTFYLNRATTTKEDREFQLQEINRRQEEVKKGLYPPIILYPEGGTTNNTELLQFKGGAFRGLHSI